MWACATLRVKAPKLFEGLDRHNDRLLREGSPRTVANSVWACAALRVKAPKLFKGLDHHSDRLLREGTPQHIANSVWACATLGVKAPNLVKGLIKHGDRLLHEGSPQNVANSVWACATVNHWPENLASKCVSSLIESGTALDCIMRCWSLLVLFVSNAEDKIGTFQHLNVAWSQISYLLSTTDGRLDLADDDIQQVLTIDAVGMRYGIPLGPVSALLPNGSLRSDADIISSNLQRKISRVLTHLGFEHELKVSPFPSRPGFMVIDIASNKYRVSADVDGLLHFLYSPNFALLKEYNGRSMFKRRIH